MPLCEQCKQWKQFKQFLGWCYLHFWWYFFHTPHSDISRVFIPDDVCNTGFDSTCYINYSVTAIVKFSYIKLPKAKFYRGQTVLVFFAKYQVKEVKWFFSKYQVKHPKWFSLDFESNPIQTENTFTQFNFLCPWKNHLVPQCDEYNPRAFHVTVTELQLVPSLWARWLRSFLVLFCICVVAHTANAKSKLSLTFLSKWKKTV